MTSVDELVARRDGSRRGQPVGRQVGTSFEKLTIDGERYFLKVLSYDGDWIMRCSGNTDHWEYKVWNAGLYARVPKEIDHADGGDVIG